ncbi:MAG: hypothetical protein KDA84_28690 [Planctomycetaceae bacterium]|nr:hypothetical protein [Planctomycetaceae bacterium]
MGRLIFATVSNWASPDEIRRTAEEVLSRPEYSIEKQTELENLGWLARILKWILETFQAFFKLLDGLPDALRWIIVGILSLLVIVLLGHILWTLIRSTRNLSRPTLSTTERERILSPAELERAADQAYEVGDFIAVVRYLFAAALLRIARVEDKPFRKGITNREILKRYRSTSLSQPLEQFVNIVDAKWYGHEVCNESDVQICREGYAQICRLAERRVHAVRA